MKKHIQQVTCARCPAQVERAWDEPGDLPEGWGQVEVHGARACTRCSAAESGSAYTSPPGWVGDQPEPLAALSHRRSSMKHRLVLWAYRVGIVAVVTACSVALWWDRKGR